MTYYVIYVHEQGYRLGWKRNTEGYTSSPIRAAHFEKPFEQEYLENRYAPVSGACCVRVTQEVYAEHGEIKVYKHKEGYRAVRTEIKATLDEALARFKGTSCLAASYSLASYLGEGKHAPEMMIIERGKEIPFE